MAHIYEKYITEAERLFEDELIDEAERLLVDVLYDEPDFAKAHNHLGWLYLYKKENWSKAEMHLNFALKFDAEYAPAYLHLGALMWKKDKLKEAEDIYLKGLAQKEADKGTFLEQLGLLYESQERFGKAIKSLEKAIMTSSSTWFVDNCKDAIQRIRKKRRIKLWSKFKF